MTLLKKRTEEIPRDVVAQLLDYGSWVRTLEDEEIALLFNEYVRKHTPALVGKSLNEMFCGYFGIKEMPETLNYVY